MALETVYATPAEFAEWWGYYNHKIDLDNEDDVQAMSNQLRMAASMINQSIRAGGMADCTFNSDAADFLKTLNCLLCATVYRSPVGPKLTDNERRMWMEEINLQLGLIREQQIDLCDGYTGKNYPAFGVAQQSLTVFNARDLIQNSDAELGD